MSSPSLAEAGVKPNGAVAPLPVTSAGPHPAVAAIGSALLLWTTFPPADWSWVAWFALAPLFSLVVSRRSRKSLYFGAWAGGMVFWTLAIQWVRLTDPTAWLAWLVMALALSFFFPGFLALCRLAVLRLRLPLMLAAPIIWVALEYVRAYVATGFPWYYLAHSQHAVLPVIQISDTTGSLGVSFVIALVNAWLVDLVTLPLLRPKVSGARLAAPQALRLAVVVAVLGATLGYGSYRLQTARFRPGPRVALLQSSFVQRYKEGKSHAELADIYRDMTIRATREDRRPDLIVWPETAYPYGYIAIEEGLSQAALELQIKEISPDLTVKERFLQRDAIAADLRNWTDQLGVPMLVGCLTYDHRRDGLFKYNSAILFQPRSKAIASFHKVHLVPFGEYVPLIETFPWLVALTPYHGTHIPSLAFGREPTHLELGPYRLATAICFEDTVPHVVQRFFRGTEDGRHPDILVNLSNDGWFHDSSEQAMHLAVSAFRTVEHRVPLIRAANTGISAIVDGNGRVLQSLPKLRQDVLIGEVPLDDRAGLYSRWGDWFGQSCLAITIGLVPLGLFGPLRRPLEP